MASLHPLVVRAGSQQLQRYALVVVLLEVHRQLLAVLVERSWQVLGARVALAQLQLHQPILAAVVGQEATLAPVV